MSLTLILGGVRSGKSARGEVLAAAAGLPVHYVATADPAEDSMTDRIAAHRARRSAEWTTAVAGQTLPLGESGCVLLDGLGVWVARVEEADAERGVDALIAASRSRPVIVVAEEAGLGPLPMNEVARAWLDRLGAAIQRLSAAAQRVELVVAGRPLAIASDPAPVDGLRRHGDEAVEPGDADHAVNVLSGGPAQWLRDVIGQALDPGTGVYPDERAAVAAVAKQHRRQPDEIVPTNGAVQALWLLPAALRPSLAVCVHPDFTEGEAALRAHGIPVTRLLRDPERDFALDPTAVPQAADLVLVGNPSSPSGRLDPIATLLALRRPGRTLVVDEAFMNLVPGEPESLVTDRLPDVIVVRSLTKALAVPGLRVGYAVAAPPLAERLRAVRPSWSVNAPALAVLAAAAERPDALAGAAVRAQSEREDLMRRLTGIRRLRAWPSCVNFCLVEVPDGPRVAASLRSRGIAVRRAESFPGLSAVHLRLTAREPAANARLVQALDDAVAACP